MKEESLDKIFGKKYRTLFVLGFFVAIVCVGFAGFHFNLVEDTRTKLLNYNNNTECVMVEVSATQCDYISHNMMDRRVCCLCDLCHLSLDLYGESYEGDRFVPICGSYRC